MADKLVYTGGTIANIYGGMGTGWNNDNGFFPTSAVTGFGSYNDTTGIITAPASGLPDAIGIAWNVELEDTSNGRCCPSSRFTQASGTADAFSSTQVSGYNRDTSEDRAFLTGFAIAVGMSASSTFQFQTRRDTDAPNSADGSVNSTLMVFPIYFSAIGVYSSTDASLNGGTTPNLVDGWTADYQSDTAQIELVSNQIECKGDNKTYWIIGGYSTVGGGGSRTQRIMQLRTDTTPEVMAYMMKRNASNDVVGMMAHNMLQTVTATRDVDMYVFRGQGVAARDGGADVDAGTPTSGEHQLIVIELNDDAETFRTKDATAQQECALTGPVDLNISRTSDIDWNDSASFTRASDTAMNVEQAMDALVMANVALPRNGSITSGSRWTARGHITVNGTEQNRTRHGGYNRGNQSTTDAHGLVINPDGLLTLAANDDIGVSIQELSGTEGGAGDIETEDFASDEGVTFMGINLDTLEASGTSPIEASTSIAFSESASLTGTGALAAAESIAFSESAALSGTGALAAATAINFSESADLTNASAGQIAAATSIAFSESATLTGYGALAAATDIQFSESADLTGILGPGPIGDNLGGIMIGGFRRV